MAVSPRYDLLALVLGGGAAGMSAACTGVRRHRRTVAHRGRLGKEEPEASGIIRAAWRSTGSTSGSAPSRSTSHQPVEVVDVDVAVAPVHRLPAVPVHDLGGRRSARTCWLVVYLMTVVAALVWTARTDRRPIPLAPLGIGAVVIAGVIYRTLSPFPAAPFDRIVYVALASIAVGCAALAAPELRRRLGRSELLAVTTTRTACTPPTWSAERCRDPRPPPSTSPTSCCGAAQLVCRRH